MTIDLGAQPAMLAALVEEPGAGLPFVKGEGTGNDFVLLPDRADELRLDPGLVRRLCDRRFGIGADGCMRVVPDPAGGWFMDYVNADGSLAEMCGNGARVYARFLVNAGWAPPGRMTLRTRGGERFVEVPDDPNADVAVDMGPPLLEAGPFAARITRERFEGSKVSMGNPHLVCPVDDPARLDLSRPPAFSGADFPDGVNVEFYARGPESLVMRVYERGSGETMSCGTGACAVAVAEAVARGARSTDILIDVPGGRLRVVWEGPTVMLHGPAHLVAAGRWWG
jgi:diaminopimelate epimerase